MIILIIYIILSAFGLYGTKTFDDLHFGIAMPICIMLGWILFPLMIVFVFGKYISHLNKLL